MAATQHHATGMFLPRVFAFYLKTLDVDRSHLKVGHILSGGAVSVGLISEECTLYHTNQTR